MKYTQDELEAMPLTDFFELALEDLLYVHNEGGKEGVKVEMSVWMRQLIHDDVCIVCHAGALMYRSIKDMPVPEKDKYELKYEPPMLHRLLSRRLMLVNAIRNGESLLWGFHKWDKPLVIKGRLTHSFNDLVRDLWNDYDMALHERSAGTLGVIVTHEYVAYWRELIQIMRDHEAARPKF